MRPLVLATVLCAAAPAHADDLIPEQDWYPRVTLAPGVGAWMGDAGALSPSGTTVQLHAEVRVASLTFLRATLEHAWLTAKDDILVEPLGATSDNAALVVRHAIMSFGARPVRFGGDLHVTAGIARERLQWDTGETLRRTQAVIGFGGAVMLYTKQYKPRSVISYQFRLQISPAADAGKLPFGCDGPCDMPTRTKPFDKTMIMELAWAFGR